MVIFILLAVTLVFALNGPAGTSGHPSEQVYVTLNEIDGYITMPQMFQLLDAAHEELLAEARAQRTGSRDPNQVNININELLQNLNIQPQPLPGAVSHTGDTVYMDDTTTLHTYLQDYFSYMISAAKQAATVGSSETPPENPITRIGPLPGSDCNPICE